MKKYWLNTVVILTLSMVSGTLRAEAGEQKITGSFSGSLVTVAMDIDGDGMPGALSMVRGKSTLGPTTAQTVGESAARLPSVHACPAANLEFPLLMAHAVIHFDDTGDLLFAK